MATCEGLSNQVDTTAEEEHFHWNRSDLNGQTVQLFQQKQYSEKQSDRPWKENEIFKRIFLPFQWHDESSN